MLNKDKLLTYLYDLANKMVVKINEAEDVNMDFITNNTIKITVLLIAARIEEGRFNA